MWRRKGLGKEDDVERVRRGVGGDARCLRVAQSMEAGDQGKRCDEVAWNGGDDDESEGLRRETRRATAPEIGVRGWRYIRVRSWMMVQTMSKGRRATCSTVRTGSGGDVRVRGKKEGGSQISLG